MADRGADRAIDLARRIQGLPRRRSRVFGVGALNDVQWDMLVHLFVAENDGEHTPLASLSIGSGAAVEDARRWVNDLVERRMIVVLSEDGYDMELAGLTALARSRVIRSLVGEPSQDDPA
ncbi:hypothetical protein PQ455_09055 [Sphingomonas naphthae]|uniref:MarR family transcriptional regulator n=1 Tax=Sphingomonas naphthae TaxID=1813468 RepID=A0ABY7TQ35_9SPHN|nr:hypothetical protein [Sphingomonas naphthae]WCT75346.1 hypothetical protein PQ455_09055 [Sphingomonas naphthae]